jgi:hypothetical protein
MLERLVAWPIVFPLRGFFLIGVVEEASGFGPGLRDVA